ncbi:growth-regulating factor 5-like isoform X2 [Nymphaea colorata]|uniref:growth-regulating factor 5-like isoform X2 n=1 Tax=Nymphaea colorata TaxID=210225 RepID=UPI00129E03E9|nr:growth-regulating factor 5-like isoform X2 [Nymphaea colorata]
MAGMKYEAWQRDKARALQSLWQQQTAEQSLSFYCTKDSATKKKHSTPLCLKSLCIITEIKRRQTTSGWASILLKDMINTRSRAPFTASQWQELEHQALIFKYMVAGVPVPPELLLPIRRSSDSFSPSLLHQNNWWGCLRMGFGRNEDPEPGRCRRTDGKKWRCSKDAFPDSKYCERHMHRGRNRSRKHVEVNSSSTAQSSSSFSSSFQALHASRSSSSPLTLGTGSYSSAYREYRYFNPLRQDINEHAFLSKGSGDSGASDASSQENQWSLAPLKLGTLDLKKESDGYTLQNGFPQFLKSEGISKQQHQYGFLSRDFMSEHSKDVKEEKVQEVQPLRCFFDDWPKTKDSWSCLPGDQSNDNSFTTTQLSISIPMASSDISFTNA